MVIIKVDTSRITDWDRFHDVFKEAFGFPDFYGRNMNAWIDCMTCLDEAESGLTSVQAKPGEVVVLQLDNVDGLCERCPEIYKEILECSALVNCRRIERGYPAVLTLSFHKA